MLCDFLAYCDGKIYVLDVAAAIEQSVWTLIPIIARLLSEDLIERVDR